MSESKDKQKTKEISHSPEEINDFLNQILKAATELPPVSPRNLPDTSSQN